MSQRKPNIVFFFSDQQRADTLGCYGQKLPVTPNLDALAREGVRYDAAYTCQPVCGPARACLQTGKYATQVNCPVNGCPLPMDIDTIAKRFNRNGYQTAYVGKWHLASIGAEYASLPVPPEKRGGYKDYWMASDILEFTSHGYDGYVFDGNMNKHEFIGVRSDCITDYAVHFLQHCQTDEPFFLFLSHIDPHHQNDHNRYEGPDGSKRRYADYEVPGDLPAGDFPGDWRENYPDYLGCCNALDRNVGKIIDTLKDRGFWENTILIYTSDHGSHFRTRRGEYKRGCYESCLRVPLILYGGPFTGGRVVKDLVSLINLPATLLELAGIPADDMAEPSLQTLQKHPQPFVYYEISESIVGRGIRTPRYTYSVIAPDADPLQDVYSPEYVEEYLYDNETDPIQANNRIKDPETRELRRQLRAVLNRKIQEVEGKSVRILAADE